MKRSHMIMIALAALVLLTIIVLMPKETARKSEMPPPVQPTAEAEKNLPPAKEEMQDQGPALAIDGEIVNPLCFISTGGEEETISYPITDCSSEALAADPAGEPDPLGEDMLSTYYIAGGGDGEGMSYGGFIGYRYLGNLDSDYVVLIVENSGGSGIFSTLARLGRSGERLETRRILATGDRCNGGIAAAEIVNGRIIYVRDVTPYDMLRLTGDPGRALIHSEAAMQLPSCAICCYGRAHFTEDRLVGFSFLPRLEQGIANKTYGENSEVEQCFDRLVTLNLEKGDFDAAGLEAFIGEVEHTCLGRTEAQ